MKIFKHLLALLIFTLQISSTFAYAADSNAIEVENQLKATYLYKFASYVDWPATAFSESNAPFIIGIVGSDEIASKLKSLIETEGHVLNNRNIEVVILKPNAPQTNVQILFIGKHEDAILKNILSTIQTHPILTITESKEGLDDGSIINFITDDNRVRFEVSVIQAERSGLKISARLLKVAKKVETNK
jgi:hypothetical protein